MKNLLFWFCLRKQTTDMFVNLISSKSAIYFVFLITNNMWSYIQSSSFVFRRSTETSAMLFVPVFAIFCQKRYVARANMTNGIKHASLCFNFKQSEIFLNAYTLSFLLQFLRIIKKIAVLQKVTFLNITMEHGYQFDLYVRIHAPAYTYQLLRFFPGNIVFKHKNGKVS